MQTYDRNVWLAASLLVLGGILVILGVSLYVKGDPEDSGADDYDSRHMHCPVPLSQAFCKRMLSGNKQQVTLRCCDAQVLF